MTIGIYIYIYVCLYYICIHSLGNAEEHTGVYPKTINYKIIKYIC